MVRLTYESISFQPSNADVILFCDPHHLHIIEKGHLFQRSCQHFLLTRSSSQIWMCKHIEGFLFRDEGSPSNQLIIVEPQADVGCPNFLRHIRIEEPPLQVTAMGTVCTMICPASFR